jgi:hypothetical protein
MMVCSQARCKLDSDINWIDCSGDGIIFVDTLPASANRDGEDSLAFSGKDLMLGWKGLCHEGSIAEDPGCHQSP